MKSTDSGPLLGLRTAIYRVDDLDRARAWYTDVLGFGPYFDEPFYVGFEVGGYELGLLPSGDGERRGVGGVSVYWGVADADASLARLLQRGAVEHEAVEDVGEGIRVGAVLDPFGNPLGIIENPHFRLPDAG